MVKYLIYHKNRFTRGGKFINQKIRLIYLIYCIIASVYLYSHLFDYSSSQPLSMSGLSTVTVRYLPAFPNAALNSQKP